MSFSDHEYREKLERIVSSSPYFRGRFLTLWEPSKAVVDLIYGDERWSRFLPEKNLREINRGFCSEFARNVVAKCQGARIEFSRNHYFVSYKCSDERVRYFDSETPQGVELERNLPFYQRERKEKGGGFSHDFLKY